MTWARPPGLRARHRRVELELSPEEIKRRAEERAERERHDARQDPRQVDWVAQFNQQFGVKP